MAGLFLQSVIHSRQIRSKIRSVLRTGVPTTPSPNHNNVVIEEEEKEPRKEKGWEGGTALKICKM